jgi:hypothetical protein
LLLQVLAVPVLLVELVQRVTLEGSNQAMPLVITCQNP